MRARCRDALSHGATFLPHFGSRDAEGRAQLARIELHHALLCGRHYDSAHANGCCGRTVQTDVVFLALRGPQTGAATWAGGFLPLCSVISGAMPVEGHKLGSIQNVCRLQEIEYWRRYALSA